MRRRIVYLITACKNRGPINQTLNIIKNLDYDVFEPFLITIYPEENESLLEMYLPFVKHFFVPTSKVEIILGQDKALRRKLDEVRPDVIHSLGVFPDYAVSKMKKWKQVITLRNYVYDDFPAKFGKVKGSILAWIHLYAMKHTTKTVTCSESLARIYKDRLGLSFDFIRNGVDIDVFEKANTDNKISIKEELGIPKDAFVYVYTGQMIERKNVGFLLDAFSSLIDSNAILLLLGDGPLLSGYRTKYADKRHIIFLGNVNNVQHYLKACDAYVTTSKSEGLPNGVLEAMATGLPVVMSDIDQHQEIYNVDKRIGFVYKQDDPQSLIHALESIRNNTSQMSEAAYESAHNNFSAQKMGKQYQSIYLQL